MVGTVDVASFGDKGRSRAQLILVAALVLATVMIGLALLLNTAITTQHFATEAGASTGAPVGLQGAVNTSAKEGIRQLNAENEANRSHSELLDDYDTMLVDWEGRMGRYVAERGRTVQMTRTKAHRGMRILQTNPDRNYTAGGTGGMVGDADWTVASDVTETGAFEQNISRGSLFTATFATTQAALADSSYHIAVTGPDIDGAWRIYIFEGVGTQNVYAVVEKPSQDFHGNTEAHVDWATEGCSHRTLDYVEVDIRAATLGGAPCDELRFFRTLEPGYDIHYNNTAQTIMTVDGTERVNRSMGTYELFVNSSAVDTTPYYQASVDESPFTLTALFSAEFDFEYASSEIDQRTSFEAQPERAGGVVNSAPRVTMTVSDEGTTTGSYDVDWSVEDPEGDLDRVELLLYENVSRTKVDAETVAVGGQSAGGETTLSPTAGGTKYDIYVLVTDHEGATTVEKTVDVADGSDP